MVARSGESRAARPEGRVARFNAPRAARVEANSAFSPPACALPAATDICSDRSAIMRIMPPSRCTVVDQPAGAEWYSGAGQRYTEPSVTPKSPPTRPLNAFVVPSGAPIVGGLMPFGRPVVPEE